MKHEAEGTENPSVHLNKSLLLRWSHYGSGEDDQGEGVKHSPVFVVYHSINDSIHLLCQFGGIW